MKLGLCSDLHLFGSNPMNPEFFEWRGDVLLLAGDIIEARQIIEPNEMLEEQFDKISRMADWVIWVPGNHEYYHGIVPDSMYDIYGWLVRNNRYTNFSILDNQFVELRPGLNLWASTLWTDFDHQDPILMENIRHRFNDFRCIKNIEGSTFTPYDALVRNNLSKRSLINAMKRMEGDVIVMTHFCPSWQSVDPRFRGDPFNGYFVQDLDDFILDNQRIRYWLHGHTHASVDYSIGDCRVLCNPRGYPNERREKSAYMPLTIEI